MKKFLLFTCIISGFVLMGQVGYVKTINTSLFTNYYSDNPVQLSNGIFFTSNLWPNYDNHLIRLDSSSNIVYSKKFNFSTLKNVGVNNPLAKASDTKVFLGFSTNLISNNAPVANISCFNPNNGSIVWSKTIDSLYLKKTCFFQGKIYLFGSFRNYSCYLYLDTLGNILGSRSFDLTYVSSNNFSLLDGDVSLDSSICIVARNISNLQGLKIIKFNKANGLKWCYEFKTSTSWGGLTNMKALSDGGVTIYNTDDGLLHKISNKGNYAWSFQNANVYPHRVYECANGDLFVHGSLDAMYTTLDKNGNLKAKNNLNNCHQSTGILKILVPNPNYFTEIIAVNSSPSFCYPNVLNRSFNATITKSDYLFSTCNYTLNPNTYSVSGLMKSDSTITFHSVTFNSYPETISLTNISNTLTIMDDVCNGVGVKEFFFENAKVKLFPSPAKDFITLTSSDESIAQAEFFNSVGMLVLKKEIRELETINISSLSSGVYVMKLYTKENNFMGGCKFIKQ